MKEFMSECMSSEHFGRFAAHPLAQLSPLDINVLDKEERRKYSRAPIKFSLFYSTREVRSIFYSTRRGGRF